MVLKLVPGLIPSEGLVQFLIPAQHWSVPAMAMHTEQCYGRVIHTVPQTGGTGPQFYQNWGWNEKTRWRQGKKKTGDQTSDLTWSDP